MKTHTHTHSHDDKSVHADFYFGSSFIRNMSIQLKNC